MANEYRIRNHPLEEVGDYTMTLYIDMLCTVASYENANPEAAYKLIANIMLSAGMRHPISEHIKNAMQLTPERFSEFVTECRNNELQYIFLIDSLLIICSNGQPCKKQIEFIAGIVAALEISPNAYKQLVIIASKLLEQDKEYFSKYWWEDSWNRDETDIKTKFVSICYVKQFSEGVFTISEQEKEKYNFPYSLYYECHLEQQNVQMRRYNRDMYYNKIIIENVCACDKDPLWLAAEEISEIRIINCTLRSCKTFGWSTKLILENSIIEPILGSLPSFERSYINCKNIQAKNCIFKCDNNGLIKPSIGCGIINGNMECTNSTFINCSIPFPEGNFDNIFRFSNCQFIECTLYDIPSYIKSIEKTTFKNCRISQKIENKLNFFKQNGCQFINCTK